MQRAVRIAISGNRDLQHVSIEWRKFGGFANLPRAIVPLERRPEAGRIRGEVPVAPGDITSKADNLHQDRVRHFVEREVGQRKHLAVHGRMLAGPYANTVSHSAVEP